MLIDWQWILHNWSDEECIKLLKKCKGAIPAKENGGKSIVIDMVVDDAKHGHNNVETQLFYDMMMMNYFGGRERTEEWAKMSWMPYSVVTKSLLR